MKLYQFPQGGRPEQEVLNRGGGPPYDDGMEARVAKLEAAVEHIQSDVKDVKADVRALSVKVDGHFQTLTAKIDSNMILAVGLVIGAVVLLVGVLAKGFHWL